MPLRSFVDSAMRHSFQALAGMTDENHAAAAAWNWLAYIHTRRMIELGLLPASLADGMPQHVPDGFLCDMDGKTGPSDGPKTVEAPWCVYVAGRMRSRWPWMRWWNIRRADVAGRAIARRGHYPFVPHTMTSSWKRGRPFEDMHWVVKGYGFTWLAKCEAILMLPGWDSGGSCAQWEYAEARRTGKWVLFDVSELPEVRP